MIKESLNFKSMNLSELDKVLKERKQSLSVTQRKITNQLDKLKQLRVVERQEIERLKNYKSLVIV